MYMFVGASCRTNILVCSNELPNARYPLKTATFLSGLSDPAGVYLAAGHGAAEVLTMMILIPATCVVGAISGVLLLLSVGMVPRAFR
jgi:hypothetical protein